jgi:hypothetical protein
MADWSLIEVEAIVADYFEMLTLEQSGVPYNKSAHRRRLLERLHKRTNGAVEKKHQNISAVLIKNNLLYINGYKPLWGFQQLLEDVVIEYVQQHPTLESSFRKFAESKPEVASKKMRFADWLVKPPVKHKFKEINKPSAFNPIKRNYLEIEQNNRSTGQNGEELVYDYEKWRLKKAGHTNLVTKIKWVSRDLGDGAGYDILSFNSRGKEIYIEVKSTKLGIETPIFFSQTENEFSLQKRTDYYLYRVFDLNKEPKLFTRNGSFQDFCTVKPHIYKGFF